MPVAAQKSTARIDTVCEAGLRPTFLFSPELRHVLAQGTGQTRATRHRKMKRAIVYPELRSAAVGRSCETVLGDVYRWKAILACVLPLTLLATLWPPGEQACQSPR